MGSAGRTRYLIEVCQKYPLAHWLNRPLVERNGKARICVHEAYSPPMILEGALSAAQKMKVSYHKCK